MKTTTLVYSQGVRTRLHQTADEVWEHVVGVDCEFCAARRQHREVKLKPHRLDAEADNLRKRGAAAQEFEELRKEGWREPSYRMGSGLCPDSCEVCYPNYVAPTPSLRPPSKKKRR